MKSIDLCKSRRILGTYGKVLKSSHLSLVQKEESRNSAVQRNINCRECSEIFASRLIFEMHLMFEHENEESLFEEQRSRVCFDHFS